MLDVTMITWLLKRCIAKASAICDQHLPLKLAFSFVASLCFMTCIVGMELHVAHHTCMSERQCEQDRILPYHVVCKQQLPACGP